jgi:hypothetical protein
MATGLEEGGAFVNLENGKLENGMEEFTEWKELSAIKAPVGLLWLYTVTDCLVTALGQ